MGTWLVHRISGLLLIILLGTKFVSGLFLLPETKPSWAMSLHRQAVLDITLILMFCLHACFALKTILFEMGFFKEKLLAYAATVLALVLSIIATVLYLRMA